MDRVTVAASESSPFIGRPQPLRHSVGVGRRSGRQVTATGVRAQRAKDRHTDTRRRLSCLCLHGQRFRHTVEVEPWDGRCTTPGIDAGQGPADRPSVQSAANTPGVLVGIWSPKGTFVRADGVANLTTGEPLRTDMQFKIASQTKAFTADLILQLIGEGKVSFDDHISKWDPGVPNGNEVTIRELLNMTSGLQTGFLVEEANVSKLATGCTEADVLAAGAAQAPLSPPGTNWSYSNYGYDLLGRVVELVTGEDVSTAIQQRIARPLGLRRTFLPPRGTA